MCWSSVTFDVYFLSVTKDESDDAVGDRKSSNFTRTELTLKRFDLEMDRPQVTLHVHFGKRLEITKVAEEFRDSLRFVRMAQLDVTSQLARFLIILRADVTHVGKQLGILVQHDVIVHPARRLRFVLAHAALELVATVDVLQVLVLQLPLVEMFVAQVALK